MQAKKDRLRASSYGVVSRMWCCGVVVSVGACLQANNVNVGFELRSSLCMTALSLDLDDSVRVQLLRSLQFGFVFPLEVFQFRVDRIIGDQGFPERKQQRQ